MKNGAAAILIFFVFAPVSFCQDLSQDPYSEQLISVLVSGDRPVLSMQEKAVNRLGDAAVIGLIRHFGTQIPITSREARGALLVIRLAFSAPEIIRSDADREPKAAFVLLTYLGYLPASNGLKQEIQDTRAFVEQQVREYNLRHPAAAHK